MSTVDIERLNEQDKVYQVHTIVYSSILNFEYPEQIHWILNSRANIKCLIFRTNLS